MSRPGLFRSLRSRLIALTVAVEAAMLVAVVWNSQRLAEEHLTRQFELRRGEITSLLQAAVGPAIVQHDYAAISETLQSAQQLQGIVYLVVFDEQGQRIAAANWPKEEAMPAVNLDQRPIFELDQLHIRFPIVLEQHRYGELQIGLDLKFLQEAQHAILLQNTALGAAGIVLSALILAGLALWLTRRLGLLTAASHDLAAGRPFRPLPEADQDDLDSVLRAFNGMAAALENRVLDLQRSAAEQRALAQTIAVERGRLDALLAAIRIGLVFVAGDGRLAYLNPSFCQLWQLDPDDIPVGQPVDVLRRRLLASAAGTPAGSEPQLFAGDGTLIEFALGNGRLLTQSSVPVPHQGGGESGRLWLFEDVTSERQTAERLLFMAERDPLTALANRSRFDAELARLMTQFGRDPTVHGALLYFDIDEFKTVNDSFGHRAGDQILIRTADAVGQLIRSNELFARLGGDEFAVIAPGADREGAQALAERIVNVAAEMAFDFDGRRLGLTVSLGIALFPEHGQSAEVLVSHADAAMYQAKHAGKNGWRMYRSDLDHSATMLAQLGWNEKIQAALNENRLVLHYQGVHHCRNGEVSHYEALVRMVDPSDPNQLLLPGAFIPAAERTGRIVDIDRWVMRAAIRQLAANPTQPALAINISARSFDDPALAGTISALLAEFHVEPRRLIVELTETSALANMQDSERFIADIRALGCTVCLDDFGVGFSSFAYLKHLSADVLKIDGMFIGNLLHSREDQVFVRAIVEVARGLGKKTVAEFVGDQATLALLTEIGVDYAQGFHLSRPVADISPD